MAINGMHINDVDIRIFDFTKNLTYIGHHLLECEDSLNSDMYEKLALKFENLKLNIIELDNFIEFEILKK